MIFEASKKKENIQENDQNLPIALGASYALDCTNTEERSGTLTIVSDA